MPVCPRLTMTLITLYTIISNPSHNPKPSPKPNLNPSPNASP